MRLGFNHFPELLDDVSAEGIAPGHLPPPELVQEQRVNEALPELAHERVVLIAHRLETGHDEVVPGRAGLVRALELNVRNTNLMKILPKLNTNRNSGAQKQQKIGVGTKKSVPQNPKP